MKKKKKYITELYMAYHISNKTEMLNWFDGSASVLVSDHDTLC